MNALLFQQGSQGDMVRRIRKALLSELGPLAALYPGLATGGDTFDAPMDAALRQWQSGSGLMADGIVGPCNLLALGLADWPALDVSLNSTNVQPLFPDTKPVNISRYLQYVVASLQAFGLRRRELLLTALGTIRAETEGFVPISEYPSKYNTAPGGAPFALYDGKLGNGKGEGARFRGRGFVQLTGRANYETYRDALGIDVVSQPDLANAPEVAAALLAAFLHDHLDRLDTALDAQDLRAARKVVNGGAHGLDRFSSVFALAESACPAAAPKPATTKPGKLRKAKAKAAAALTRATPRVLNTRKDAPDLRDRDYQPPPVSLHPEWPLTEHLKQWLPNYAKAGLILDQGQEGACTGFGLAGVVNYLRWVQQGMPAVIPSVSPRMLYNMARRHDEYGGENYEGSSCRGAIKGWFSHGVCLEEDWPYSSDTRRQPRFGYAERARAHTLGVYYRIKPQAITDLQAAIQAVGAVYVSSYVHPGWDGVPLVRKLPGGHADLPVIDFDGTVRQEAGHAYALVGFNTEGFILQNSWGPDWGAHGFAVITYEDWLAHAMDAWVVAMGVPGILAGRASSTVAAARAKAGAKGRWWSEAQAREHSVILGNDGRVHSYLTEDERTRTLSHQVTVLPDRWFRSRPADEKKRLLLYVHGGLNSEDAGLKRAQALGRVFDANGCYPLFVVWKTGLLESLGDILGDWRRKQPAATGLSDWLTERSDALIESTVGRKLAKPIWSEMKENAELAHGPSRAGDLLVRALSDLVRLWGDQLEIHLVGHSAGSIWLGHLIGRLQRTQADGNKPVLDWVPGVHLYAPACTVQFANEHYAASGVLPRTHIALLSDKLELDDNTAQMYRKSLLYLVSNALEPDPRTPILGLHKVFDERESARAWDGASSTGETLRAWRRAAAEAKLDKRLKVIQNDKVRTALDATIPAAHGSFDNDIDVLTATLQLIRGGDLLEPVTDLRGF
ncbi:C1 family peptidase [Aquabacterium sp.]|uniref:C1 family peptidase n=1 Tax=Aquabacterium sp. TaxID=1872578 RepID=UPI0024893402|nr:C1 family peptidase [Aquabacterium sp.]MDI1347901.1 C1 family peptidase [Aquabacterium sp.]